MKELTVPYVPEDLKYLMAKQPSSPGTHATARLCSFSSICCAAAEHDPQGEPIEVLLGEADCANPLAVLKNIVYRLRKLLEERGVPRECILHAKSSYSFSGEMPCRIDIEEYEETCGS